MEGAAYLLQLRADPELEATLDEIAEVIEGAQHGNGYLYPSHTTGAGQSKHMMGDSPYTFIVHSHELYNVGHLYEAAIAYYQATGKDKLLKVAEKSAQHINKVIFEGDPEYNAGKPIRQAPGHQEMELALVKLYRVTGKQLYLDMARKFLEIRGVTYVPDGEGVMSPTYAQQHAPVVDQKEAVGHAVRATYLYSAMADVGTLTGDARYGKALDNIWGNVTTRECILREAWERSTVSKDSVRSTNCRTVMRLMKPARQSECVVQLPHVSAAQRREVSGRRGSRIAEQRSGRSQPGRQQILLREPARCRRQISLQPRDGRSSCVVRYSLLSFQHGATFASGSWNDVRARRR